MNIKNKMEITQKIVDLKEIFKKELGINISLQIYCNEATKEKAELIGKFFGDWSNHKSEGIEWVSIEEPKIILFHSEKSISTREDVPF